MRITKVVVPGERIEGGMAEAAAAMGFTFSDEAKAEFVEGIRRIEEAEREADRRGRNIVIRNTVEINPID